ncbi:hypothetical protein GCM10027160_30280 [Streptomyces calidiresistens]
MLPGIPDPASFPRARWAASVRRATDALTRGGEEPRAPGLTRRECPHAPPDRGAPSPRREG